MGPGSVRLFAALCSGDPMAKPVGRAADHKSMDLCGISSPLGSSCTGALPVLPGHLLGGSTTTTPARLRSPLPTLTCPCGGDDLGLAAGTISLGCVGSDRDGVGGFRQQASNDRLLGVHPRDREEANEKSKHPLAERANGGHGDQHLQQQHTDTLAGARSRIAPKHTRLASLPHGASKW